MTLHYLSGYESDRGSGILNMQIYLNSINESIRKALQDMIKFANEDLEEKILAEPCQIFCSGDAIFNFNYTYTIEILFDLSQDISIPSYTWFLCR